MRVPFLIDRFYLYHFLQDVGGAGVRWLEPRVKAWSARRHHIHLYTAAQPGRAPVRHYHPDGHSTRLIFQRQGAGKQDRTLRRLQPQSHSLQVDRNRSLNTRKSPAIMRLYLWDALGGHAQYP